MSRTRIFCLGDLHLGRPPSRLPAEASGSDEERRAVSTANVWLRAVDAAIEREVDLVLLSGDVVDRDNRYFEARSPLEEGIRRLAEAGVEVCAVSGNHDFEVFPRLAELVSSDRFHLLGAGGRWERFTLHGAGGSAGRAPLLHVDGWSFPRRDVRDDPTAEHALAPPADGAPVLGLVHGDLNRARSTNAPLSLAALERAAVDAWVLGHLHTPQRFELGGGRWALYPGSPQPLDPTEEGPHGAWLVEVVDGRLGAPEMVPLATLRWETLAVDLADAVDGAEARDRLAARAWRFAEELLSGAGDGLRYLLLRARFEGRTAAHRDLEALIRERQDDPVDFTVEDVRVLVPEIEVHTRLPLDPESLSDDEPPGLLAELAGAIESGEQPAVLSRLNERVRAVYEQRAYVGLGGGASIDPVRERERAARVGWALVDALLEQKALAGEPRAERSGPAADGGRDGGPVE